MLLPMMSSKDLFCQGNWTQARICDAETEGAGVNTTSSQLLSEELLLEMKHTLASLTSSARGTVCCYCQRKHSGNCMQEVPLVFANQAENVLSWAWPGCCQAKNWVNLCWHPRSNLKFQVIIFLAETKNIFSELPLFFLLTKMWELAKLKMSLSR